MPSPPGNVAHAGPLLMERYTPPTHAPTTSAPAAVQRVTDTSALAEHLDATGRHRSGEQRTVADARIAAFEGQLQWVRDDIARLQQLLNNTEREGGSGPHGELERRQESLQKNIEHLRLESNAAYRSFAAQRSTIDALNRRVAALEATLIEQHKREVQTLDNVIEGMEKLLETQAGQTARTKRSRSEEHTSELQSH